MCVCARRWLRFDARVLYASAFRCAIDDVAVLALCVAVLLVYMWCYVVLALCCGGVVCSCV